jgi:hypothetical protein
MDTPSLARLRAAFVVSPDNMPLLVLLLKSHLESGAAEEAYVIIRDRPPESLPDPIARCLAADAARAVNQPQAALAFLTGDSAEEHVSRARVLLALGRLQEALIASSRI